MSTKQLHTQVIKQSEIAKGSHQREVYWRIASSGKLLTNSGIVVINNLPAHFPGEKELDALAEMVVIRHILFEKAVFDEMKGKVIELHVGSGQTRKALERKSEALKNISFAANFYHNCLSTESSVKVRKNKLTLHPDSPTEAVEINMPTNIKTFETGAMGQVDITRHAQERFVERHKALNMGDVKNPYKVLTNMIHHPKIIRIELEDRVKKHKLKKYKDAGSATEVWTIPSTPFYLTFVREQAGTATLVTVFTRSHQNN